MWSDQWEAHGATNLPVEILPILESYLQDKRQGVGKLWDLPFPVNDAKVTGAYRHCSSESNTWAMIWERLFAKY